MQKLLFITPDMVQSGVWKTNKAAGLLWQEGNNIVFRNNGVEKVKGATQLGLAQDQVRDMAQAYISATGAKRIYVGTDTKVRRFDLLAGVWTPNDILTWPTAGQYADLETWGTWLIATNGIDPVKVWKNVDPAVNLAGTPFTRAKVVKRKEVFLFAFNTNNGDTRVEWSDASNPENWTIGGASRAGNFDIRDLESEIVAVEDLGPRHAVYSRNSLVLGSFVGGTNAWGWKRAVTGIGAVSNRSVVSLDPFNYGLMPDGIFKTDGVSFTFVDDPAMTKYIKDTADFSKASLFWGFSDAATKTVSFYFLNGDNQWRSLHLYPEKGYFTKGDLQLTAGDEKSVFDFPLVASEDQLVGSWQTADSHFAFPLSYSLKTKPLDFGELSVNKLLNLIEVNGVWSAGAKIKVCALDDPEGTETVVIDRALEKQNYFEYEAPLFTVEFYGSTPWTMNSMGFYGILGGPSR